MAEMMPVCQVPCGDEDHGFLVPPQIQAAIYADPQSLSKDKEPLIFVCLVHARAWELTPGMIHQALVQTLPPGLREASVWQVEYECAQRNCGLRQTIYTKYYKDAAPHALAEALLTREAKVACKGGHTAIFDPARMTAQRLE